MKASSKAEGIERIELLREIEGLSEALCPVPITHMVVHTYMQFHSSDPHMSRRAFGTHKLTIIHTTWFHLLPSVFISHTWDLF